MNEHMSVPSADRLGEFAAVVDAGSISAAARRLALPRASLSRRITKLEATLGVRLLHRRTRRLVLTPAGEELYRRARRIAADAEAAWAAVRRLDDVPRGLLRVTVTGPIDRALVVGFLRDHPEIQLEIRHTTRVLDLVAEGVDVALRFGEVKDPNLIVRRLWLDRSVVVGAPEYLERAGTPAAASELSRHECLVAFAGEWTPHREWPLRRGGSVTVGGRLRCNDIGLLLDAAVAGLGLALLPSGLARRHVDAGALVSLLADEVGAEVPASLVYADREYLEPKVRAFVDHAAAQLRPPP